MKKGIAIVLLVIVFLLSIASMRIWDGVVYVTDDSVMFAWDLSEGATHYEVRAEWIDPATPFGYDIGTITDTSMQVPRPRTGHFVLMVRACNGDECSDWARSSDPDVATVDGLPKAWRVFWKVPLPGDIIIE